MPPYLDMDQTSLSHPRALTQIKDPIHDVISITCFEREVVDSKHFQRLHFVMQNSTTYVAFPSNKNSRFSHSLGVAHICGEMFVSALANAMPEHLDGFLETAANFVHKVLIALNHHDCDLTDGWKSSISGVSGFRHAPSFQPPKDFDLKQKFPKNATGEDTDTIDPYRSISLDSLNGNGSLLSKPTRYKTGFLVDVLWQAVRICGLVHDIGHLPMSHSSEEAIERYVQSIVHESKGKHPSGERINYSEFKRKALAQSEYEESIEPFLGTLRAAYGEEGSAELRKRFEGFPVHEQRSLYIFSLLYLENRFEFQGNLKGLRSLVFHLSFLILFSSISPTPRAQGDTPTVASKSGPFGISNGEFRFLKLIVAGSVDGDRLDYTVRDGHACGSEIGRFSISEITKNALLHRDSNGVFGLVFKGDGLAAIEQFFNQRHQGYKHLIYHRTSARTEVCFQQLLVEVFKFCRSEPQDEISKHFASLGYIKFDGEQMCLFPLQLEKFRDRGDRKLYDSFPLLDDANLRGCFQWMYYSIEDRLENDDISDELKAPFGRIKALMRVVLFRDFSHIYDPFKNSSITSVAKQLIGETFDLSSEKIERVFSRMRVTVATSEPLRKDFLSKFERDMMLALGDGFVVLASTQIPKVYSETVARKKGEQISLVVPPPHGGVLSTHTDNGLKSLIELSPTLRSMSKLFFDEFRINVYVINLGLRSHSGWCDGTRKSQIDHVLLDCLRERVNDLVGRMGGLNAILANEKES